MARQDNPGPRSKDRKTAPNALRIATGLAVLAVGAVTLFDRLRVRKTSGPTRVLESGRGTPASPPSAAAVAHGYETVDTNVRALATIMVVAIVLMAGGVAGVFALYAAFGRYDRAQGLPMTVEQQAVIVPPQPHLQADPLAEIAVLRMQQGQALTTYGYADPAHRQPHIPIARAMQQLVGQSLDPAPPSPAPQPGSGP